VEIKQPMFLWFHTLNKTKTKLHDVCAHQRA